ncbi:MAG TPA: hypothetical protein VJ697_11610 [Nitrososphaeraceae archaeon]|nr:hypothetical protein [Nitrososphaeraceae archaeon]
MGNSLLCIGVPWLEEESEDDMDEDLFSNSPIIYKGLKNRMLTLITLISNNDKVKNFIITFIIIDII